MLSDLPKPAILSSKPVASCVCSYAHADVSQPGSTNEAVSFFTNLTVDSGKATIRLRCTIPTWSSATDTCVDLYDLHELKSRALDLIHELLVSLRSSGMTVSYSLAPSDSSICIVSESQRLANFDVLEKVMRRRLERGNVALLTIDGSPCLVLA